MARYDLVARDIMQVEVATILDDATIVEAAEQMRFEGVRSLIVIPHHEHDAYGIIAYADIVRDVLAKGEDPLKMKVHDVMTKPAITIPPTMSVQHIATLFKRHRFGHVPVVDGGELLGIVSMTDLVVEVINDRH